jgi:hypothetical protein
MVALNGRAVCGWAHELGDHPGNRLSPQLTNSRVAIGLRK